MIDEFLKSASSKLGIGEDAAKSATGGLIGLIKEHASGADFAAMAEKIPGVSEMAEQPAEAAAESGGGIGGMLGGLGGALGGGAGALGALGALSKSGLSTDKIGGFVQMFSGFIKEKLGGDMVKNLLGKIPGIGSLLG